MVGPKDFPSQGRFWLTYAGDRAYNEGKERGRKACAFWPFVFASGKEQKRENALGDVFYEKEGMG